MKKNYATYVMLLSMLFTATTYAQTPDFNLSVTNIVISENDRPLTNVSESISITMVSQPTNDVVVTPVYTDQTEFSVSPSTLTFTSSNWNVAQSFTFTSINDNIVDGDVSMNVTMTATTTSSHDSGSGDGSHDSGSGDGSHDSGSGDGSHDSGSGDGSHDSGSGDGSHDSGSGDGSHDSGSGDGSHDSGSGDGSHDSGSGDGSHDSGSGDGSHDSGSGDGSHDSGSGDGSSDATTEKNLSITILDYNQPPSNIADFAVKIGFNTEDYILVSISDPDGDQISLNTTKALDSGTVSLETGNLLYSPNKKFFGSDTLGIKFTDAIFTTNQTTIDIDVIGLGDMNGDGSVSAVDLVFLASNAVGITGYEIPDTFNNVFDVNQDGVVNTVDLVYLASYMVGIDGYNLTIK
jgi:hypothetical protein